MHDSNCIKLPIIKSNYQTTKNVDDYLSNLVKDLAEMNRNGNHEFESSHAQTYVLNFYQELFNFNKKKQQYKNIRLTHFN